MPALTWPVLARIQLAPLSLFPWQSMRSTTDADPFSRTALGLRGRAYEVLLVTSRFHVTRGVGAGQGFGVVVVALGLRHERVREATTPRRLCWRWPWVQGGLRNFPGDAAGSPRPRSRHEAGVRARVPLQLAKLARADERRIVLSSLITALKDARHP